MEVREKPQRLAIYPKDVQKITGRSNTWSTVKIKEIKEHYNLKKNDLLTVKQFCEYMKWDEKEILKFI